MDTTTEPESHIMFDRLQSVDHSYLSQLFEKLDKNDGIKDGQIDCKFLLKYLDDLKDDISEQLIVLFSWDFSQLDKWYLAVFLLIFDYSMIFFICQS